MAASPLLRGLPLLRLRLRLHHHHHRIAVGLVTPLRRRACAATESTRSEESVSSANEAAKVLRVKEPIKYHRIDDPDYRKWKAKEEEILRDIEPITLLTKEILHSERLIDIPSSDARDVCLLLELMAAGSTSPTKSVSGNTFETSTHLMQKDLYGNILNVATAINDEWVDVV